MFGFGKKTSVEVPAAPTHVECRSWNGTAFHIRAVADESGLALCGYEPLDDRSPIDRESLEARLPLQHEGWHYCRTCVAELQAVV